MKKVFLWLLIISIAAVFSLAGCKAEAVEKAEEAVAEEQDLLDTQVIDIYKDVNASIEDRVEDLLSLMTLEEKIGQMTQVERMYITNGDIAEYVIGSVLSGGGSTPYNNTPEGWADMYDSFQKDALSTRLGIPIIYGVDAVHGHNNLFGATIFPHNIGLGATRDPELVKLIAQITAIETAATGVDWTFGPCITVPQDERWGRTYEGFSEDPELVAELGKAAIEGYQGADLSDDNTILACAKHFVGDGGTVGGVDRGNTQCTEEDLKNIYLYPYLSALEVPVGSIMVSFSSWNGVKMHSNLYLINDVLKEELGFEGFVVSDWAGINDIDGVSGISEMDIQEGINAGIDMVMVPDDYLGFINMLTELVNEGKVSEARIDDAVRRILTVKFELGLFENPYADRSYIDTVGSEEHREIARKAVRESLVLLKNEGSLLPLSKDLDSIVVAGGRADDIGSQCGGWTITWQGAVGEITEGTSILEAIKNTVSNDTIVTYSADGSEVPSDADVAIVVVGETPYAEFTGDDKDLLLSTQDIATINNVLDAGIPVAVILISGRTMIITSEIDKWDALVAAWLPGTEGQGVADVIFGDYAPTGKLSYTWPRSIEQLPINDTDGSKGSLFPFGFGLTY
ncbi:MAG: glycoside hydrolase family 3 C-terminal domain-containing protein [Chloroflexi bacterium]|nr:glycoside hydrolase family 3 C-terminal domain-containing protein [Chloroflexota bacterium]MBE3115215.1 glycoside hydrolase family 3 C-terminal domain-containing protein [Actinomycetota bacterium]